jgi:hypothetical protein
VRLGLSHLSGMMAARTNDIHRERDMSKEKIQSRIEAALATGKNPGLFDMPKALSLKNSLEACDSVDEVATVLEQNKVAIMKIFKISEAEILSCIQDVKEIG